MKKTIILLPLLVVLSGCGQSEEPAEPLSPQAQAALKSGNTGIPPAAAAGIKAGPPAADADKARGTDMKKPGG